MVGQIDTSGRLPEHHRRRNEHLRFGARIVRGIGRLLRERDVARLVDETLEVSVRDREPSIQKPFTVTSCAGASSG
jgi:hypothetical protein